MLINVILLFFVLPGVVVLLGQELHGIMTNTTRIELWHKHWAKRDLAERGQVREKGSRTKMTGRKKRAGGKKKADGEGTGEREQKEERGEGEKRGQIKLIIFHSLSLPQYYEYVYDKGSYCDNMYEFFGPSFLLWFFPVLPSSNGIRFPDLVPPHQRVYLERKENSSANEEV